MNDNKAETSRFLVFFLAGRFHVAEGAIRGRRTTEMDGRPDVHEVWFVETGEPTHGGLSREGWYATVDVFVARETADRDAKRRTKEWNSPRGGAGGGFTIVSGRS